MRKAIRRRPSSYGAIFRRRQPHTRRILQTDPSDEDAQLALAAILLYANDLRDAKPLLGSVLATDAGNARATRLLTELVRREAEADRPASVAGGETHVPFVTAAPLPVVRVVANGVTTNFFVDTGADVELDPSFAAKLGVKTQAAGSGTFAGGRQAPIRSGILNSLAVGDATASDVPVHVLPIHASLFFPKLQVDGIIGTTYFERFLVTIDYPHNQLILRPRSPQVSEAFQARAAASGATIVQCYLVGDHFVMAQAQVNDASPGLFLFDSGLAGGGLMPSADLIKAAGITLNEAAASSGEGGGGAVTGVPFIADRVAVGSAAQRNVAGIYTPAGFAVRALYVHRMGRHLERFLTQLRIHGRFRRDEDRARSARRAVAGGFGLEEAAKLLTLHWEELINERARSGSDHHARTRDEDLAGDGPCTLCGCTGYTPDPNDTISGRCTCGDRHGDHRDAENGDSPSAQKELAMA